MIPSFNITYRETADGTEVIVDDLKGFYNALLDFVMKGYYDRFETNLFCEFIDKDGNIYKSDVDEYNLDSSFNKIDACLICFLERAINKLWE